VTTVQRSWGGIGVRPFLNENTRWPALLREKIRKQLILTGQRTGSAVLYYYIILSMAEATDLAIDYSNGP